MPEIKNLLKRIFTEDKVRDNLNPEEVVALGATMEAAGIEEKDKINFNLQDIIAYNLGIETFNPDPIDNKTNGNLMYPIIKKFTKIPFSLEKKFGVELKNNYPRITVKFMKVMINTLIRIYF